MRESVITYVDKMIAKTEITKSEILKMIGIEKNKYYDWLNRSGIENRHNANLPKGNWLLPEEYKAIIDYAKANKANDVFYIKDGYRRLSYRMLDENIVAVSSSTVYRVLKEEGLLNIWNTEKRSSKGNGFIQPTAPHEHWHTDIKYVNYKGTFLFLISVIDGFSRYIVHHELRQHMTTFDVELTLQIALEKLSSLSFNQLTKKKPRIISDNGGQFISKDFALFIKEMQLIHIRTSVAYPQANGKIESYHKTINGGCLKTNSFVDIDDAKETINEFVEYYNNKRLHSALNYLPPIDYLNGNYKAKLEQRDRKLHEAALNRKLFWNNINVN